MNKELDVCCPHCKMFFRITVEAIIDKDKDIRYAGITNYRLDPSDYEIRRKQNK